MTVKDYLAQADRNRAVADVLAGSGQDGSLQWAVTCAFYAALHYVNAYLRHFVGEDGLPANHGQRDDCVSAQMRAVYHPYRTLRTDSELARYHLTQPDQENLAAARARVEKIEQFVRRSVPTGMLH